MAHTTLEEDLTNHGPYLTGNGIDVGVAASGVQAFQQLLRDQPSLAMYADFAQDPHLVLPARHIERVLRSVVDRPDSPQAGGDAKSEQEHRYALEQLTTRRAVVDANPAAGMNFSCERRPKSPKVSSHSAIGFRRPIS